MPELDLNFAVVGILTVNNVRLVKHMHVPTHLCDVQTVKLNKINEFCFMFWSYFIPSGAANCQS